MKNRIAMLLSVCFACMLPRAARAQEFRNIQAGLPGVGSGFDQSRVNVSFGDFDHDGDLDILMMGMGESGYDQVLKVFRNDNGHYNLLTDFHELGDSLTNTAAWADINHDGNYELITWLRMSVMDSLGGHDSGFVRIYRYDAGQKRFVATNARPNFPGILNNAVFSFADVDHDGYPDLLVSASMRPTSRDFGAPATRVFKNNAGTGWTDITGDIVPVSFAVPVWKDIDGDGDLDLFLAGSARIGGSDVPTARVYKFTGGQFKVYDSLSVNFMVKSADFGDYDGDHLQDVVLCGGSPAATQLYHNTGTGFQLDTGRFDSNIDASAGSVAFGDIDNDGDPDLIVTGENFSLSPPHFTKILYNDGGNFYDLGVKLPPFWYSFATFVDFDGDGNQDLFLAGTNTNDLGQTSISSFLYRNVRGDFHPLNAGIDSIAGKRVRWGDFDNDRRLDLVACGQGFQAGTEKGVCRLYHNGVGGFARQKTPFDTLYGDPELGDFDGDGKLDILLAGGGPAGSGGLRLFRNTGNGFQETPLHITGADPKRIQNARFGDFDNDGDLDLAVWGEYTDTISPYTHCYSGLLRNDGGGKFTSVSKGPIPNLCSGEMEWGDYDRDGDLDILFAGDTAAFGPNTAYTAVYRNDNTGFVQTGDRFLGLSNARVAWGDFDKDGDLDFVETGSNLMTGVAGGDQNVPTTIIYRLVGGRFEEYYRPTPGVIGDVAWIDFDNDGDLDLITSGRFFSGLPPNVNVTLVYRNDGTTFTTLFPQDPYMQGTLAVGDYDNDGDLDFAVCGRWQAPHTVGDGVPVLKIYRNTLVVPNLKPATPAALASALGLGSVKLSWGASADAETPPEAMQYNLRIGRTPGSADVMAPASLPSDGYRSMPAPGNAGHIQTADVNHLASGTYYWSVQGIDNQMAGSPFGAEQSFTLGLPAPSILGAVPGPGPGSVTLRWNRLPQANFKSYYIHYGLAAGPAARMDSISKASDTSFVVNGLTNGSTYHFRLSASDLGGNVSAYSAELTAVPDGTPPSVPDPVTALPGDRSVTLTWRAATESDFLSYLVYQRNASGPIVKIDSITDIRTVTKTVSGLKNGTPYSFLLVAVDKVGNHSGFSKEAVAIPAYLLTPASPALAFGKIHLLTAKDSVVRISNASDLPVPMDSVRFVNAAFSLHGMLGSLPAKAETSLTVRFAPANPTGGDFSGVLKLYYGGAALPLEIELSGTAAAPPWCHIAKIVPADVPWDTGATISFLSVADDSDDAGQGDRITAYLWSSSLQGPIGDGASGFTLKSSELRIGAHTITLRVIDNEGDTSLPAQATLSVRSRKPLVRLDSISPRGLIIRGADRPHFHCTAYDLDEFANAEHDSLHLFALYSTLQGRITSSKDTTLDSSALALGLHGFYAMAVDNEGDTSFSDTTWVPVQAGVGMALIAAGTDFNDNLYFYQNIAPNCNWVYAKLRERGFTDSLITYFNPVGWQSIGGDYHQNSNIVDETQMTTARLRDRILGYKDRVRNGVPLVISLLGHGGRADLQNGKFYLSPTEFVTPDSLNAWLDTYNHGPDGRLIDTLKTPIVLVLDFCFSGTFLPKLKSATQNRYVVSSASADRQAYFQNGQSFSYAFFKQIGKGGNLAQAWAAGKAWSDANTLLGQERANPLANADGNDVPNESGDLARMTQIYIGGSQQNQSPDADWKELHVAINADARTLAIRAVPEGAATVDTAWFTLLAPDFNYASSNAADPFVYAPLQKQPDGSFADVVKLDNVLAGDYLVIVYGMAGGEELMPLAGRQESASSLVHLLGAPMRFELGQNYPNPALHVTYVPFAVTRKGPVTLKIWDMSGNEVRTLAEGLMAPGFYRMRWDGRDGRGRPMPAGFYTYRLTTGEGVLRRKLVWRR